MASKRNSKAVKRGKKVRNLMVRGTQAKGVKGGFQWGVGRSLSGSGGSSDKPTE